MGAGAVGGVLGDNSEEISGATYRIFVNQASGTTRAHVTVQNSNPNTANVNFASATTETGIPHSGSQTEGLSNPEEPGVMVCNGCLASFTLFKRKKQCLVCSKVFCPQCFGRDVVTKSTFNGSFRVDKHCLRCRIFHATAIDRSELMMLKVKDLRAYLHERNVQTKTCKEKSDLVDLVIRGPRNSTSQQPSVSQQQNTNPAGQTNQQQQQTNSHQPQHPPYPQQQAYPQQQIFHQPPPFFPGQGLPSHLTHRQFSWSGTHRPPFHPQGTPFVWNYNSQQQPAQPQAAQPRQSQPQTKDTSSTLKVEDLETEDAINNLSVRQLKHILDANFVDYKGCFEKRELLDRAKRLWTSKNEYKKIQQAADGPVSTEDEDELCKICMDAQIECVLLECGHMVTCVDCGKKISDCPLCRQNINRIVRVFKG